MNRLFSGIIKEALLIVRDIPGLAILFVMPVLLIMTVTLAQDTAMKSSRQNRTEILFIDLSDSPLSKSIRGSLDESKLFKTITTLNGKQIDFTTARTTISSGDYPLAIIITEKDSTITLLTDPSLQETYRKSIAGSVTYFIKGCQAQMAVQSLLRTMNPGMDEVVDKMIRASIENLTPVRESFAVSQDAVIKPSVIQNNVPGFILFAMFFIVIPISGGMITEKSEGPWQRMKTLPVSPTIIMSSRVIVYVVVCLLQFLLMMVVGTWALPVFFGLEQLQLGHQYLSISVATVSAALAAVGFGLLVGTISTTHGQAALFGSVMVVLLGLISGTFLPVYLLPKALQYISYISPIRWGIDTYLIIFIREGSLTAILPKVFLLLLFFILSMIVSISIFARKTR